MKRWMMHVEAAVSSALLTTALAVLVVWVTRDGWVRQWGDAPQRVEGPQMAAKVQLDQPLQVMVTDGQRLMTNIGVEPVHRRLSQGVLRALGRVVVDETTRFQVTARTEGRLERVWVKETGTKVGEGQRVASIYSPELLAVQDVYLTARSKPGTVASPLMEQSKKRLALLGMSSSAIRHLERDGVASPLVDVNAQESGVVAGVLAQQGQYVMQGDALLDLVDLSKIWVEAEVFGRDLAFVALGTRAKVRAQGANGEMVEGVVNFVYPYIDAERRTTRVRLSLENPDGKLRPDQYVDVLFDIPIGPPEVVVPASAVILTGGYSRAWVEVQPNVFEVRLLRLGARTPDGFVVVSGVREDEQVLVKGVFLVDSQATLEQPIAFRVLVEGRHPMHRPGGTVLQPGAIIGDTTTCPVMEKTFVVEETSPRVEYKGETIYFCCNDCDKKFLDNPEQYLPKLSFPTSPMPTSTSTSTPSPHRGH